MSLKPRRDYYGEGFRLTEVQFVKMGAEVATSYVEQEEIVVVSQIDRPGNGFTCINGTCYADETVFWIRQEW